MPGYIKVLAALGIGLASLLGYVETSSAEENSVTAIDIALEPDATMMQHAQDANARLLKAFPKGFALDETHHPHISILQQFVRTADLDKAYAAAEKVFAGERPTSWKLKTFKYYYIPSPPIGLAGIVVQPTQDLHRLQRKLIHAIAPFTVKTGTAEAFVTTEEGRDIQSFLIEYVANFVRIAAGKKFNPHVTIGVGTETYLNEMLAEPFEAFTFSPMGASVYQLGSFGTARKELKALVLKP
jgi:hypothetical protein